ncbi:cupin domain-containing protein [Mesorhizobium australicum]|uniref:Cupin domain-containing protein n=1 Tax=Mesorhizobium australicum TaxID=536018 RepID=A0A1X7PFX4_9HYPH|nr:cupin domain-containing protein [Mesorhizobium australicum]SMH49789.1 Cupin domain-containing protein [Mesorhizobium australicum]
MSGGPIVLGPTEGRVYEMPDMRAVFKADGEETGERYSVSEWWVKLHGKGPGPHLHATEDELFYVIAGTMSVMVADAWRDLAAGSFIRIPAGTVHDFENRTTEPAALLNVFMGAFEHNMPAIVAWYEEHR